MNFNRFPIILMAIFTLVCAAWGGLLRLGWALPLVKSQLIVLHGPLMVCGFFGTLISMERAVAIEKPWAYSAPLLTGVGSLLLIAGFDTNIGKIMILAGSIFLVIIFLYILKLQSSLFAKVMTLGALCWVIGNLLWLINFQIFQLVCWWIGFLLLTIAGERLELARLSNISEQSKKLFIFCTFLVLTGLIVSIFNLDTGIRLFGLGLTAFTIWLVKYDIARRTIKTKSITRFIAASLLSGYFWLGLCGITGIYLGSSLTENLTYDTFLHSFFLGFTFSMIFGHAPIIFPAVLKIQMKYHPRFYLHLFLLHISVLIRVISGLTDNTEFLKISGMLNAITLLLFLINTLSSLKINKVSFNKSN